MIDMHVKFITILILYHFLVQAVLFWTPDRLWLCSLAPLLVDTTLAYPLAHSSSSGHAVVQISWTHRTPESSKSPCEMGSFLSQCDILQGKGFSSAWVPLHPLGLSPRGIRQASPPSLPCVSRTLSLQFCTLPSPFPQIRFRLTNKLFFLPLRFSIRHLLTWPFPFREAKGIRHNKSAGSSTQAP